jgi:N-dimethylarginine dimethylaminohydrolase
MNLRQKARRRNKSLIRRMIGAYLPLAPHPYPWSMIKNRQAAARRYLMCPPEHFTVSYAINPWMRPDQTTDSAVAMRQWAELRETYLRLGHDVRIIEPVAGLPDMVYAANGATVVGGKVLGARFRYAQRAAEADGYLDWFRASGYEDVWEAEHVNEGEGDILFTGTTLLAGYGFRSDQAAAEEAGRLFGLPVISLRLVDPRYYHLDTAMCALDADTAMYYPAAFDDAGRAALAGLFSELIEAKDEDAEVLGLNAVSDGRHVVLPGAARGLTRQLADRGFEPIGIDMSELLKGGGGPKCCTLELRP